MACNDYMTLPEFQRSRERIALLARMDSIGRTVANLVLAINNAYIMAMPMG